jgi:hypothetical protein
MPSAQGPAAGCRLDSHQLSAVTILQGVRHERDDNGGRGFAGFGDGCAVLGQ